MRWDQKKRLSYLPENVHGFFTVEAAYLLRNLESQRLTIKTKPAPDPRYPGHKIRFVVEYNPTWYSIVYWEQPPIRRDRTLWSLERIAKGLDRDFIKGNYKYRCDTLYRDLVFERLTEGSYDLMDYLHPNNVVRRFFEMEPVPEEEIFASAASSIDTDNDVLY